MVRHWKSGKKSWNWCKIQGKRLDSGRN